MKVFVVAALGKTNLGHGLKAVRGGIGSPSWDSGVKQHDWRNDPCV